MGTAISWKAALLPGSNPAFCRLQDLGTATIGKLAGGLRTKQSQLSVRWLAGFIHKVVCMAIVRL